MITVHSFQGKKSNETSIMFSNLFKPKDTRTPDEKVREKGELLTE